MVYGKVKESAYSALSLFYGVDMNGNQKKHTCENCVYASMIFAKEKNKKLYCPFGGCIYESRTEDGRQSG